MQAAWLQVTEHALRQARARAPASVSTRQDLKVALVREGGVGGFVMVTCLDPSHAAQGARAQRPTTWTLKEASG